MPNFVSFAAFIAELARGEKSRTQSLTHSVTHPAYLICREPKLLLRKSHNISSSSSVRNIFFIRSDVRRTKDDKAISQDSHKALNDRPTNAHSPEWIDRLRQRQRQKLVHYNRMRTSFLRLSVFNVALCSFYRL